MKLSLPAAERGNSKIELSASQWNNSKSQGELISTASKQAITSTQQGVFLLVEKHCERVKMSCDILQRFSTKELWEEVTLRERKKDDFPPHLTEQKVGRSTHRLPLKRNEGSLYSTKNKSKKFLEYHQSNKQYTAAAPACHA